MNKYEKKKTLLKNGYLKVLLRELNELKNICIESKKYRVKVELSPSKKFPTLKIVDINPIAKLRSNFLYLNNSFICGLSGSLKIDKDESISSNKWSVERIGFFKFSDKYDTNFKQKLFNARLDTSLIFKVTPRLFKKSQARYYIFEDKSLIPPKYTTNEELNKKNDEKYYTKLLEAIKMSLKDNTLVLMSSFINCKLVFDRLIENEKINNKYKIFYCNQGEGTGETISKYKKSIDDGNKSILVGNLSYYTGIDLPMNYINTLVVGKLPFEPIESLYSKQRIGSASSINNMYNKAVLMFRQGLGRGVRTSEDKCFISICDPRILKREKRYKTFKYFLEEFANPV